MIKTNIRKYVRWLFTIALLYGVYTETGIFTTWILLNICIAIEIIAVIFTRGNK